MTDEFYHMIVAVGVPVLLFAFGLWIKSEIRDKKALDDLKRENQAEHSGIRSDMNEYKDLANEHHMHLRDKIEKIWQHMVKKD